MTEPSTIPMPTANTNEPALRVWHVKKFDAEAHAWTHVTIHAESLSFTNGVAVFIANDIVLAAFATYDYIACMGDAVVPPIKDQLADIREAWGMVPCEPVESEVPNEA